MVEYDCPLFLLGADVMRGRCMYGCNFSGIKMHTARPRMVHGFLKLNDSNKHALAELTFCLLVGSERFSSSMVAGLAGGLVGSLVLGSAVCASQHI